MGVRGKIDSQGWKERRAEASEEVESKGRARVEGENGKSAWAWRRDGHGMRMAAAFAHTAVRGRLRRGGVGTDRSTLLDALREEACRNGRVHLEIHR